jgi:hypothetical protein
LRADGNKITSIDGLQRMDGLVKLSLHENGIRDVDLAKFRWSAKYLPFHYGRKCSHDSDFKVPFGNVEPE